MGKSLKKSGAKLNSAGNKSSSFGAAKTKGKSAHNGGYMKAGGAGNGGHGGVAPHGSSGSAAISKGR